MTLLGIAAIDPIGIGLILLLLTQQKPYKRSLIFLFGSFVALIVIGLLFAEGLGIFILKTEDHHHWLAPSFQILAGSLLIIFGLVSVLRKQANSQPEVPTSLTKYVSVSDVLLFIFGFILVIIQSIIDVVFALAMTHVARMHLSSPRLIIALTTYTLAALSIQIAVVILYATTPIKERQKVIKRVNKMLDSYGDRVTIIIGFILGTLILVNGILTLADKPHF